MNALRGVKSLANVGIRISQRRFINTTVSSLRIHTANNKNRLPNTRHIRFEHSSPSIKDRLEAEGLPTGLTTDDLQTIITYAKSVWPPLARLPPPSTDWSSAWENWTYLLTFYWHSPHYLRIPQIDMIANILYRLPGETRGVLFSNKRCQFIFTLYKEPSRFFLYDMSSERLFEFYGVEDEDQLVTLIEKNPEIDLDNDNDKDKWRLRPLQPDPEGQEMIQRIMERDQTVIPVLVEKFLDYTPEHTTPWEENQMASTLLSEEQRERLERLATELGSNREQIGKEDEERILHEVVKQFEEEFHKKSHWKNPN